MITLLFNYAIGLAIVKALFINNNSYFDMIYTYLNFVHKIEESILGGQ